MGFDTFRLVCYQTKNAPTSHPMTPSPQSMRVFARRALVAFVFCAEIVRLFGSTPQPATEKVSRRSLTFAERVAYQRAIEEVYWRHRIWPKENSRPKPSFDEVISQAGLENKVRDYLQKSQVLESRWEQPIAGAQLQGEIDRMARDTRQPELLSDLFEALGNDPLVVAECLARPILLERYFNSGTCLTKARNELPNVSKRRFHLQAAGNFRCEGWRERYVDFYY